MDHERFGLQLQSLITPEGQLTLSLARIPTPAPAADEVVVRVAATPINPSDIGLLLGAADVTTATVAGTGVASVLTARVPAAAMPGMAKRLGDAMPVGNEGAGTVVAAGASAAAQALLGKTVAMIGGGMYAQFRCLKAADCLALGADATAVDGASSLVNPLTALGMIETMRGEGHTALVHTAAASSLGQMLNRLCTKDGIGLVNIVRSDEQVALLRALGAAHVCNSQAPTFAADLTDALVATGATLAFDAIGGGRLAGQILAGMEAAIGRTAQGYSRYGSAVHKQVYIYGGLDLRPTEFTRSFGMAWGIGGWLVFPFLQKIGPAATQALRDRIVAELKTTFATRYTRQISLVEALQPDIVAAYGRRSTGEKYLIDPTLDGVA